jgi:hypothetical protein
MENNEWAGSLFGSRAQRNFACVMDYLTAYQALTESVARKSLELIDSVPDLAQDMLSHDKLGPVMAESEAIEALQEARQWFLVILQ